MKRSGRVILMGIMFCWGVLLTEAADLPGILKIYLSDRRGCFVDENTKISVEPDASGWEVNLKKNSLSKSELKGNIPRQLSDKYMIRLWDAKFLDLQDEYKGKKLTTGDGEGCFSIVFKEGDTLREKKVKYSAPLQCPPEFKKVFDIIWELQDYAIGSLPSLKSEEPMVQQAAVFLLGNAFGQEERSNRVIKAHVYSKKEDELISALLELKKRDPNALAKEWMTNPETIERVITSALYNIRDMKE